MGLTFVPSVLIILLGILEGSPARKQRVENVSNAGQKRVKTGIGLVLFWEALPPAWTYSEVMCKDLRHSAGGCLEED